MASRGNLFKTGLASVALCFSFLTDCSRPAQQEVNLKDFTAEKINITLDRIAAEARDELGEIIADVNLLNYIMERMVIEREEFDGLSTPLYMMTDQVNPETFLPDKIVIDAETPEPEKLEKLGENISDIRIIFGLVQLDKTRPDSEKRFSPKEIALVDDKALGAALSLSDRFQAMIKKLIMIRILDHERTPVYVSPQVFDYTG